MDPYREVSIIVGALYILGLIAGILSIAQVVDDSNYLTKSARNKNQIYSAACFQFLMAIFYIGVAILLYPLLKNHNEKLALGFLSFRMIAGLFVLAGTIILLFILKLSQEYVKMSPPEPSPYYTRGSLLKKSRDLVNHVAMVIMLCIGGIMLFIVLIQSGLIPLWISVWGLAGSSLAIIASILVLFKYVDVKTPTYLILNIPIALQEIVFAVWLLMKGFK